MQRSEEKFSLTVATARLAIARKWIMQSWKFLKMVNHLCSLWKHAQALHSRAVEGVWKNTVRFLFLLFSLVFLFFYFCRTKFQSRTNYTSTQIYERYMTAISLVRLLRIHGCRHSSVDGIAFTKRSWSWSRMLRQVTINSTERERVPKMEALYV